ncbi:hypothetical protein RJ640_005448 [Escallonia rubra]|uniref:Signal peptidase complex subunit 1 n=1 Tax=Escallonia rubra TaxID=112253 RepID=A0AA88RH40_9ASTE|nr:hypothetical protein RJ640_005448 [Escallonia rubra]
MDWQGKKLAEQLMQIMLAAFAAIALVIGYGLGSFKMMLLVYAGGAVLTTLITVPNWPFFNRNPLKWLDPSEAEKHPKPQSASSTSKKKATKKRGWQKWLAATVISYVDDNGCMYVSVAKDGCRF